MDNKVPEKDLKRDTINLLQVGVGSTGMVGRHHRPEEREKANFLMWP